MTDPAEGYAFPHPDSPAGREEDERMAEEEYIEQIEQARREAQSALIAIRGGMIRLLAAVTNLDDGGPGSGTLYDVEYADGGGPRIVGLAFDQITVALAAIEHQIPEPTA